MKQFNEFIILNNKKKKTDIILKRLGLDDAATIVGNIKKQTYDKLQSRCRPRNLMIFKCSNILFLTIMK